MAKDLDLFLLPESTARAMKILEGEGFATRIRHVQWLAEALMGDNKVDLVFGMGNWMEYVDPSFLEGARRGVMLGVRSWVAPAEEIIYSKAFVASRSGTTPRTSST